MIGLAIMASLAVKTLVTGNDLLDVCRTNAQPCRSYVAGVADTINSFPALKTAGVNVCTDANVTLGQRVDVVVKFLVDHPADRNDAAASLIAAALTDAFPCSR